MTLAESAGVHGASGILGAWVHSAGASHLLWEPWGAAGLMLMEVFVGPDPCVIP